MKNKSQHALLLTQKQRNLRLIFRIALISCMIIGGYFFSKELIFPTYSYKYRSAINSLANTISRPYITEHGTAFDISASGEFTHTTVTFTLPKDAALLPHNTTISLRKSYSAFLAPINTARYTNQLETYEYNDHYFIKENDKLISLFSKNVFDSYLFKTHAILPDNDNLIANTSNVKNIFKGFASGTLIKSADGIFVIDGETKRPIQDEFVFSAFGYNYDNVLESTSEERGLHEKARMFDQRSTHPYGTLFYAEDAKRLYIYDQDRLHKIEPTAQARQYAILVDELSRDTYETCTLTRKLFFRDTYTCQIPLMKIASFPGNTFQFVIDAPQVDITTSHITLSTAPTNRSFSQRVASIKKELRKYYIDPNEK